MTVVWALFCFPPPKFFRKFTKKFKLVEFEARFSHNRKVASIGIACCVSGCLPLIIQLIHCDLDSVLTSSSTCTNESKEGTGPNSSVDSIDSVSNSLESTSFTSTAGVNSYVIISPWCELTGQLTKLLCQLVTAPRKLRKYIKQIAGKVAFKMS